MAKKITTIEMECVVANYLNYRSNLIVPNVCWGMNIHECDLLVVTAAGYCWEVEIKVTKSDLKKDAEKTHGHNDNRIKRLYFAIPKYLEDAIEYIPKRAGIITVAPKEDNSWSRVNLVRNPIENRSASKLSDKSRDKVARLGAMRIWRLKRKIIDLTQATEA